MTLGEENVLFILWEFHLRQLQTVEGQVPISLNTYHLLRIILALVQPLKYQCNSVGELFHLMTSF